MAGSAEAIALAVSAALCGAESLAAPIFKDLGSPVAVSVSPAYGAVILVNVVWSGFALIGLGMKALETYPLFLALSIIGGVKHPITTALAGVLWIHGRKEWAAAYAKNGPAGRYASKWSRFIWWALIATTVTTLSSVLSLFGILA